MIDKNLQKSGKLDTWKEISSYLGVSDTTARHWEKTLGLPVRRVKPGPKARVWAKASEIDAWMERVGQRAASPAGGPRPSSSKKWVAALLWAGLVVVAAGLAALLAFRGNALECAPVRGFVEGATLKALDDRDRVCWTRSFDNLLPLYYRFDELPYRLRIADFDGDREGKETLFAAISQGEGKCLRPMLYLLSASGEILWERDPSAPIPPTGRKFQQCFDLSIEVIGDVPGDPLILVFLAQQPYFPMRLAAFDLLGRTLGDYWHPGKSYPATTAAGPARSPGERLLWTGGFNNPGGGLGRPFLAVLDFPFRPGPLMEPEEAGKHYFDPRYAIEKAYFFFPRIDVFTQQALKTGISSLALSGDVVQIAVGMSGDVVLFKINRDFEIVSCNISDNLRAAHQQAFMEGKLDHPLTPQEEESWCMARRAPSAMNGNLPQLEAELPLAPWSSLPSDH